ATGGHLYQVSELQSDLLGTLPQTTDLVRKVRRGGREPTLEFLDRVVHHFRFHYSLLEIRNQTILQPIRPLLQPIRACPTVEVLWTPVFRMRPFGAPADDDKIGTA